jgi:hypothetical protein
MNANEIADAVRKNQERESGITPTPEAKTGSVAPQTVPAVGGVNAQPMSFQEIQDVLKGVHGASMPKLEDGTRVHIQYESFGKATPASIQYAKRAEELGLSRDRYTGRVHSVWVSGAGNLCLTMWVELERDHMYRTFNLVQGKVYRLVVLGE